MENLKELREQINKIDKNILEKLKERFEVTSKVGKLKKDNNIKVYDFDREKNLKKLHLELCKDLGLDIDLVKNIFDLILIESKKKQL